ncbi:hypothetical protein KVR01_005743 [Diaporthe batatas]|uniref:uncharacterized protein n=1 Tax=Diaporthe batatas TaxID=748121 RepID=UPI001D05192C|nr:uncharacterized protein KVR01_005743 [Diaporthe batatas]KAG8163825.1 hypothetical protein KVR01_005743 [Diaporthe batatas]
MPHNPPVSDDPEFDAPFPTSTGTTPTSTGPLAIRTSFIQPSDCKTQWKTTAVPSLGGGSTVMSTIMISEPAATCYPSGWDDITPESRLHFSPGVCPKGWVYHAMQEDTSLAVSTAFCCQSGFDYAFYGPVVPTFLSNPCGKYGDRRDTEDTGEEGEDASSTRVGTTFMVHEGWAITWAKSDTATMTPKLPTLTNEMRVPTWTPGQKIRDGEYDRYHNDSQSSEEWFGKDLYWFLVVGVPIIFVLSVASCVWCGVRKCRRDRRPDIPR